MVPEAGEAIAEIIAALEPVCSRWRGQVSDRLRATLGRVLPSSVTGLLRGLAAEHEALAGGDGRTVPQAAQRALQPAGTALVRAAWRLQGHAELPPPEQRPCCAKCGGRSKLVRAHQSLRRIGRFGAYELERPYYTCEHCGGGYSPGDAAWGLGAGGLDPDLQELVARDGVESAFEEASKAILSHLQVRLDDNTVQRDTVAIGLVALDRIAERAASDTCRLGPDPGSDIMVLEVDGGRVEAGGRWRESKVAVAGPLGPELVVDERTGREHLRAGPMRYAADIGDADGFFARQVRQLAEDAGLYHPRVRCVTLLGDGGGWIENRWAGLTLPAQVQVFDILDLRHFEEHVWDAAKACWGEGSAQTKAWAETQITEVLNKGPEPLLKLLPDLQPDTDRGRDEMRKLQGYVADNAHRLRYPEFIALKLPIASGAIEAGVRIVNNERVKNSCMHWSVPGARAVLALRAIALSGRESWDRFWATNPQLTRPTARELGTLRAKVA